MIDDDRDTAVRIEGQKLRAPVLELGKIRIVWPVGQPAFLEHDRDLVAVWCHRRVQVDHAAIIILYSRKVQICPTREPGFYFLRTGCFRPKTVWSMSSQ